MVMTQEFLSAYVEFIVSLRRPNKIDTQEFEYSSLKLSGEVCDKDLNLLLAYRGIIDAMGMGEIPQQESVA